MYDASTGPGRDPLGLADWVLTLHLSGRGGLLAILGNGNHHSEMAEGPWPPPGDRALPAAITNSLQKLAGARLKLQLPLALDAWAWEGEMAAALPESSIVPRYLLDLGPPAPGQVLPAVPLVAVAPGGEMPVALLQAARAQERPLIVLDAASGPDAARMLEAYVRKHWRDPLLLSDALGAALVECRLPYATCRLYGDGRTGLVDAEQGRRPVTAVSIDVVRSTFLLLAGDEAYAQRLQAYYTLCRDVIVSLHGFVDPPQGNDGLMAYFGFPLAVEDSAARGLTAAWQVSRRLKDLGLAVRIGVASGNVAVSARQAFGSDVHLAARLREVAEPGQVLVSASTRERVGNGFTLVEQVLDKPLKDYPNEKSLWRLDGVPAAGAAVRGGGAGPFVGREREREQLRLAWARARGGSLQWCCVEGEPGIGKSRLLREFATELQKDCWPCLELVGQEQSAHSPFAALIDGLLRHERLDAAMDMDQVCTFLAKREASEGGVSVRGTAVPDAVGQRQWRDLLLGWLMALPQSGPFCLLIDDAQWLDPSSIELLRRLREVGGERAMLVCTFERSDSARAATLLASAPIELHGLDPEAAAELAAALAAALPERERRRIVERAEGVPLYLEEESLRLLEQRDDVAPAAVPATLEDLLMVRLDALGPDRTLAQLISVFGRECSEPQLTALLAQDDPFVEQARRHGSIGSLLQSGLIQVVNGSPPGFRFKHALIRDAAYGSIWSNDRRRLHGLCADLIERHLPETARQRPEQLAQHLGAAGRPAAARRAWQAAAQLAAARQAHAETLELAQRALALTDAEPDPVEPARATMRMQLLVASAQIALQGYGSSEVEAAYLAAERAGAQLDGRGHTLRIRLGLEACFLARGDLARAERLARSAVAETRWDDEPRLALQARWALANVQFHQGDWRAALAGFDDCLAHYRADLHRRSGVQDPAVMCLGYSSWVHVELGQADEALDRIDRMLVLAEELNHPFSTGVAHGFAASVKRLCGDSEGAWPHALEALRVCERGDFRVWLAHAVMVCGQLRADQGDGQRGDVEMLRGFGLWIGAGARVSCATYRMTRAEILLRQGRTAEATAEVVGAWQDSESIGERHFHAELLRLQGLCAWQAGDVAAAADALRRALALAEREERCGLALRCALSLGALEAAAGGFDHAAQRLRALADALPRHRRSRDLRWAHQSIQSWESGRTFAAREHTPWEPR